MINILLLFRTAVAISAERNLFNSEANPNYNVKTDNPSYYDPTLDELEMGYTLRASKYWGIQMRKEKCLRIAFSGGSQTANIETYTFEGVKVDGYIEAFKKALHRQYPRSWDKEKFKLYMEGVSGHGPSISRLSFFDEPSSEWPNVVSLEYALNCEASSWDCVIGADNLINRINEQYHRANLTKPAYFFLEFFRTGYFYGDGWFYSDQKGLEFDPKVVNITATHETSVEVSLSEIKDLAPHSTKGFGKFGRGGIGGMYFLEMARFYGYPFISVKDALFPSFVRFYSTHLREDKWPYGGDGVHMWSTGCKVVGEDLILPFLLDQMIELPSDKAYLAQKKTGPYDVPIRMFPEYHYISRNILAEWSSWGANISPKKHLRAVIVQSKSSDFGSFMNGWAFTKLQRHEHDETHICYGSFSSNQPSLMVMPLQNQICQKTSNYPCVVEFEYVHSWNQSYIAMATCDLYSISASEDLELVLRKSISNKVQVGELIGSIRLEPDRCPMTDFVMEAKRDFIQPGGDKIIDESRLLEIIHGTYPCAHRIPILVEGRQSIEKVLLSCQNNEDAKLACLSRVAIIQFG